MNTHQPYLQVSNIRGYYGESYIVQDVSFTLEEKQVLALLGRNGAGKTSTLKCIARAEEPLLRRLGVVRGARAPFQRERVRRDLGWRGCGR